MTAPVVADTVVIVADDPRLPIILTVTGSDLTGMALTGSALVAVDDAVTPLDALPTAPDTPVEGTSSLHVEALAVSVVDAAAGIVTATPGLMFESARPGVYGYEISADGTQVLRGTIEVLRRHPDPPTGVC